MGCIYMGYTHMPYICIYINICINIYLWCINLCIYLSIYLSKWLFVGEHFTTITVSFWVCPVMKNHCFGWFRMKDLFVYDLWDYFLQCTGLWVNLQKCPLGVDPTDTSFPSPSAGAPLSKALPEHPYVTALREIFVRHINSPSALICLWLCEFYHGLLVEQ